MSWAITRALSAGAYEPIRRAAQTENLQAVDERCLDDGASVTSAPGALDLTLTGGPMLLSAIACTVALLWFFYGEARMARMKAKSQKSREAEILETPSLAERTCKMRSLEKRQLATAERESPAYDNQDLRLIARLVRSRNLTQLRVDAASNLRTDGPITLNDVPMLLSVMRDMFGFAQQEFAEGVRREDRFSQYLRASTVVNDDADGLKGATLNMSA